MTLLNKYLIRQVAISVLLVGYFFCTLPTFGQGKMKDQLKDKEDGKFDMSDWIIDANGFIPIPILITEPALGGFGGALGLAFLKQVPNSAPNITTVLAGYTANNSWFVGGIRSINLPEKGIKYRFGTVYTDLNMAIYKELPLVGEQKFNFNFKMLPLFFKGTKKLGDSKWYLGAHYAFLWNKVGYNGELPSFVKQNEINSIISTLGPVLEFDSRDNTFTPNKGTRFDASYNLSANWLGSDYDYSRVNLASYSYWPIKPKWIVGLRAEYQQVFNSPPFYMLPGINLRGVPVARYQNYQTVLTEVENRFDISKRSSIMAFGGLAKAFDGFNNFGDATLAFNYGTGYRYLIARKFGIRMGVDVAFGPDDWGYYIIFGSNWLR